MTLRVFRPVLRRASAGGARRRGWAAALWCTVVLVSGADAMSIREMRALQQSDVKHGGIYVQYYLVGAMEGAMEANAQAIRTGAKALFCLNGRRLEPQMAQPLFATELKRNEGLYEADMPVQLVLVNALANVYTC